MKTEFYRIRRERDELVALAREKKQQRDSQEREAMLARKIAREVEVIDLESPSLGN